MLQVDHSRNWRNKMGKVKSKLKNVDAQGCLSFDHKHPGDSANKTLSTILQKVVRIKDDEMIIKRANSC